jgi:hypothetical protein
MKVIWRLLALVVLIACALSVLSFVKTRYQPAASSIPQSAIDVASPKPGDAISSPLSVSGQAPNSWYFEASFPIVVTDWDGLIIGEGHAQAQSDWTIPGRVPFKATIQFIKSSCTSDYCGRGSVILKKDNPSGLPQYDASVEIPVRFE